MNYTNYNLKFLKLVILQLVSDKKGVTISSSFCNENLVEFSPNNDIWIDEADDDGDSVIIKFHQKFYDEDLESSEIFHYETIQLKKDLDG